MKKLLFILICLALGTVYGLYTRPSFLMVGQLNWYNVITKGYFQNKVSQFFTQNMIDESFYHVLKMQTIALALSLLVLMMMSFLSKTKSVKKQK